MWRSEHSHSQSNSHFGRGSPGGLLKFQRAIWGDKTQWLMVLYIIEKLLKRRCLKWARIAFSDIWNTSYGRKKGRESNCQFDSWAEKFGNRPDLFVYRRRATYCWKALDESYNFASDRTSIGGVFAKLCGSKVVKVPASGISRESRWRAPKSRGETKLKVSQSQVAESRLGSTLPASNSRKG